MTRQERKVKALRPYKLATIVFGILALLTLTVLNVVYYKGQTNWIGVFLISAIPFFNVAESLAEYRLSDEYERSLMLRAVGLAGLTVMLALYILSVVSAGGTENVPSLWILSVFILGWLVYSVSRTILQRREAQE